MGQTPEKIEAYKELRERANRKNKELIQGWCLGSGLTEMTVSQVNELTELVVHMCNRAASDAFQLGCTNVPAKDTQP
ncbi:hypothetical protein [Ruegeria jejuensis]|uniref:hypothetical protein n=1 Tax=Ruegeria jejuensis TaxID=3233338 RepID=UPI00355AE11D